MKRRFCVPALKSAPSALVGARATRLCAVMSMDQSAMRVATQGAWVVPTLVGIETSVPSKYSVPLIVLGQLNVQTGGVVGVVLDAFFFFFFGVVAVELNFQQFHRPLGMGRGW